MKNNSIKAKIGIWLIVFGFFNPLLAFIVPFLNLSEGTSALLIAFFLVGGPEVFMILGGILAGKEGLQLVTDRMKKLLGLPVGRYPAPKGQYNLALVLIFLWLMAGVIFPYILPYLRLIPFLEKNLLYVTITFDVILLLSIFLLGGNQMIVKIGKLVTWEKWELPDKKD